jgi:hypothetical protein
MMACSYLFKYLTPNSPETSWSPQMAGMLLGSLQVPSIILLDEPLGLSYALVAAVSPLYYPLVFSGILPQTSEVSRALPNAFKKFVMLCAAVYASYVASNSDGTYGTRPGLTSGKDLPFVTPMIGDAETQAFIGGVLLWLGARIQGGCTSGHGISGFSFLKKMSLLAVIAMFSSAIITANLIKPR